MVLCGYNNKHYDQYILKAILLGYDPWEVNDYIINQDGQGWNYEGFEGIYKPIPPQIDLMNDTLGLSLKEIEGNIGWNIKESDVDFTINRPLTNSEIKSTIEYCKADVAILPKLWDLRKDYNQSKVTLCEMSNIPVEKGLGMTNAKLTASFLGAVRHQQPDRRDFEYYKIPNIRWELIPIEVTEYFDNIKDYMVSDEDFESSKLDIVIGGIPTVVASGGLHGARSKYFIEKDDNSYILNYDVGSMYPTIVLKYGYASRNIVDTTKYEEVYHTRLTAKHNGDKKTANALKLVLNTFYGAMNNEYNDLYDPSMNLATCVTGQLLLIELINDLDTLGTLEFIQYNTDGIMFKCPIDSYQQVIDKIHKWEELHGLTMEEDRISKVAQRDVNNYAILMENGKVKFKGGELSDYNPDKEERWKHHSLEICAEALVKKLIFDTPIEETILCCNELSKFQMIGKTGHTYFKAVRVMNGEYRDIQRVNRIFAGTDPAKGTIYKVKHDKDKEGNHRLRYDKLAKVPIKTLIDGYDTFTIDDIDKQWYVDYANSKFQDFKGGK